MAEYSIRWDALLGQLQVPASSDPGLSLFWARVQGPFLSWNLGQVGGLFGPLKNHFEYSLTFFF